MVQCGTTGSGSDGHGRHDAQSRDSVSRVGARSQRVRDANEAAVQGATSDSTITVRISCSPNCMGRAPNRRAAASTSSSIGRGGGSRSQRAGSSMHAGARRIAVQGGVMHRWSSLLRAWLLHPSSSDPMRKSSNPLAAGQFAVHRACPSVCGWLAGCARCAVWRLTLSRGGGLSSLLLQGRTERRNRTQSAIHPARGDRAGWLARWLRGVRPVRLTDLPSDGVRLVRVALLAVSVLLLGVVDHLCTHTHTAAASTGGLRDCSSGRRQRRRRRRPGQRASSGSTAMQSTYCLCVRRGFGSGTTRAATERQQPNTKA